MEIIKNHKNENPEKKKSVEPEVEGDRWNWFYVCGECHGVIDWKESVCRHCRTPIDWGRGID